MALGREGTESDHTYTISTDGFVPELEHIFIYKDSNYHFWFYAQYQFYDVPDRHDDQSGRRPYYHVRILTATTEKKSGGLPRIQAGDLPRVENNIRQHFNKYTLHGDAIDTPDAAPSAIIFDWGLR